MTGPGKPDYLIISIHRGIGTRLLELAQAAHVPVAEDVLQFLGEGDWEAIDFRTFSKVANPELKHCEVRALEDQLEQIRSSYAQSVAQSLWSLDEAHLRIQLEGMTTLRGIVRAEVDSALETHY